MLILLSGLGCFHPPQSIRILTTTPDNTFPTWIFKSDRQFLVDMVGEQTVASCDELLQQGWRGCTVTLSACLTAKYSIAGTEISVAPGICRADENVDHILAFKEDGTVRLVAVIGDP